MIAISPTTLAAHAEAEQEVLTGRMDRVMQNDVEETSVKLR